MFPRKQQADPTPAPARVSRQRRPDGKLYGVIGKSRSGKTAWTSRQVDQVRRLLVWDYKGEWSVKFRCRRISSLHELGACVRPGAPAERLAFCAPGMSERVVFDRFCRLAYVWLQAAQGTLIIEETASVTTPSKAPAAYGNATVLHCHMMQTDDDQAYVARKLLAVPLEQFKALEKLQWIERHEDGALRTGIVAFKKSRTR